MWCPYARLSLGVPSSLQMSDSSWLSYLFLLFLFVFRSVFFWGGGVYSSFYINHFNGPVPMTKNKIKPQQTPISEILFWMFCLVACTLTLSPGPHQNRNPKPSTPENRICLHYNVLNHVLKCLFLQCFRTSTEFALKIGPQKNDNFAQCAKQNLVF